MSFSFETSSFPASTAPRRAGDCLFSLTLLGAKLVVTASLSWRCCIEDMKKTTTGEGGRCDKGNNNNNDKVQYCLQELTSADIDPGMALRSMKAAEAKSWNWNFMVSTCCSLFDLKTKNYETNRRENNTRMEARRSIKKACICRHSRFLRNSLEVPGEKRVSRRRRVWSSRLARRARKTGCLQYCTIP